MDVMQKFRDRFRRSSSGDVTSICIAALPSDSRQSFGVVRRYSTAEGAFQAKAKPRNEKSVGHGQITVESLGAIRKEETIAIENKHKNILQENDKLQNEKENLAAKLQNSFEKILERDETIQKLRVAMEQMKQERLQDEEVRYHRSILAKRQYTIDLENELEKMKGQIKKMNCVADRKVQKAKEQIAKIKQDCALKVFEIKQENAKLVEDLARLSSESSSNKGFENKYTTSKVSKDDKFIDSPPDQTIKTGLILQLSEQISNLDEENLKLKEEMRELKRTLSRATKTKT